MPRVTVAVNRNLLWSLRFNENTNILLSNIDHIDYNELRRAIKNFQSEPIFRVGDLSIIRGDDWELCFPGLPISFGNWIVSSSSPTIQTVHPRLSDEDVLMLLDFLVHMHDSGALSGNIDNI